MVTADRDLALTVRFARRPELPPAITIRSQDPVYLKGLHVDESGGVVLFGSFEGVLQLPAQELVAQERSSIFALKYDAGGNIRWARAYHAAGGARAFEGKVLGDELLMIGRTGVPTRGLILALATRDGTITWERHLGAPGDLQITALGDAGGAALVGGTFKGRFDADAIRFDSRGQDSVFFAELDVATGRITAGLAPESRVEQVVSIRAVSGSYLLVANVLAWFRLGKTVLPARSGRVPDALVASYDPQLDIVESHSISDAYLDAAAITRRGLVVSFLLASARTRAGMHSVADRHAGVLVGFERSQCSWSYMLPDGFRSAALAPTDEGGVLVAATEPVGGERVLVFEMSRFGNLLWQEQLVVPAGIAVGALADTTINHTGIAYTWRESERSWGLRVEWRDRGPTGDRRSPGIGCTPRLLE